jgi:Prophage tail length tape measure protein
MGIGDLVANLRTNVAPMAAGLNAGKSLVGSFASFVRSTMAPVKNAFEGAFTVSGMLRAAGEKGKAEKLLASQVAGTGEAAGLSAKQMIDYAQSLQRTTGIQSSATEGAMSLLTTFRNVKGDQFKDAIKQAQNLSTVLGVDLNTSTRLVGKALNDPVNSLKLLRKAGVQFTDQQKSQIATMQAAGDMAGAQKIILAGLEGSFGGAAENMASPMAMLKNSIFDISASLGGILGPGIKVVAQTLNDMLEPLAEARGSLQMFGKLIASFIGVIFKPFGQAIGQTAQLLMGMWAGGSVSAASFGNVAKLAMDNMTLGMMDLLPNGEKIFTDLGVTINAVWEGLAASTAALWEDIKNGFSGLSNFVMSRAKGLWAGINAGIHGENPLDAYNKAVDQALQQQIPAGAYQAPIDAFWSSFNKAAGDATQGLQEQGGLKKVLTVDRDKLKNDVSSAIAALPKLPGITVPDFKKRNPIAGGPGGGGKKEKKEWAEKDEKLESFEANSKEALQALAEATRGDSTQDRIADATERTAAAAERTADAAEKDDDEGGDFDLTGGGF